jgi:hypothetical protein
MVEFAHWLANAIVFLIKMILYGGAGAIGLWHLASYFVDVFLETRLHWTESKHKGISELYDDIISLLIMMVGLSTGLLGMILCGFVYMLFKSVTKGTSFNPFAKKFREECLDDTLKFCKIAAGFFLILASTSIVAQYGGSGWLGADVQEGLWKLITSSVIAPAQTQPDPYVQIVTGCFSFFSFGLTLIFNSAIALYLFWAVIIQIGTKAVEVGQNEGAWHGLTEAFVDIVSLVFITMTLAGGWLSLLGVVLYIGFCIVNLESLPFGLLNPESKWKEWLIKFSYDISIWSTMAMCMLALYYGLHGAQMSRVIWHAIQGATGWNVPFFN